MKKEIMVSGLGWISSGIICIAVWIAENNFADTRGLFFTGLIVIIVGTWLLLSNKRIERLMVQMKAKSTSRARKRRY